MSTPDTKQTADPDTHKGAVESDTPSEDTNVDDRHTGVDVNGLPNDPIATAQDRIGAHDDESEGG